MRLERYKGKKFVKHSAPKPYLQSESTKVVFVKSSTPYVSALKRIERLLKDFEPKINRRGQPIVKSGTTTEYVQVKGMGKAIGKVTSLGVHFKYEKKLRVDTFTRSIGVLDEFVDPEGEDDVLRKRNVSAVELHIYIPK